MNKMRHELIHTALGEIGVKELPGPEANTPRILEYFAEIKAVWVKADETAWCSASHNFIAKTAGYEYTGALNGRSWLDIGIPTSHPEMGDTVIFWYGTKANGGGPNGWRGHVGFYIRQDKNVIWTLGGNQSNSYRVSPYLVNRMLGARILRKMAA